VRTTAARPLVLGGSRLLAMLSADRLLVNTVGSRTAADTHGVSHGQICSTHLDIPIMCKPIIHEHVAQA
jgi:hypothetical protein